mgnify:CR=1 FL=1
MHSFAEFINAKPREIAICYSATQGLGVLSTCIDWVDRRKIIFDDYNFQIIDSGIKRILSDSAFNDRKNMCDQSAEKMGLECLCDRDIIDENLASIVTIISGFKFNI